MYSVTLVYNTFILTVHATAIAGNITLHISAGLSIIVIVTSMMLFESSAALQNFNSPGLPDLFYRHLISNLHHNGVVLTLSVELAEACSAGNSV